LKIVGGRGHGVESAVGSPIVEASREAQAERRRL
jgi:hypothetical protein